MYLVYFYHQCRHLALQSHTLFIADSYPGLTFSLQSLTQALPFSLQTLTQAFPSYYSLLPRPSLFIAGSYPGLTLFIAGSYPGLPFSLQSLTQAFPSYYSLIPRHLIHAEVSTSTSLSHHAIRALLVAPLKMVV